MSETGPMIRRASAQQTLTEAMAEDTAAHPAMARHLALLTTADLTDGAGRLIEASVSFTLPEPVQDADGPIAFTTDDGTEIPSPPMLVVTFDVELPGDA